MAGSMSIVQDDSHHGMGPWLQCIVLDESITAQLHDRQPTLSAEACTRLSQQACMGKPQHSAIKESRTAAAASAVNRARLVHGDGVDVQVHLPHACVAFLEMKMRREVGNRRS